MIKIPPETLPAVWLIFAVLLLRFLVPDVGTQLDAVIAVPCTKRTQPCIIARVVRCMQYSHGTVTSLVHFLKTTLNTTYIEASSYANLRSPTDDFSRHTRLPSNS